MHLLLLGATGGCGRWVAKLARRRGHTVSAIVRTRPADDSLDGVTTIVGDVRDPHVLGDAISTGATGVISTLGIRRRNPRNPWSPLLDIPSLAGPVAEALTAVVPGSSVRRVVMVSSAGVADSAARTSLLLRWVFNNSNVRIAFDDLERMEQLLAASSLDWIAPRPTRLVDGPLTGQVRETSAFRLTSTISRADVAAWMLDAVARRDHVLQRLPMITGN
jgi:putative NADH-flavin reductase